uniref:Uncharacterized protein n=1 Tax=Caenorhabditis japonica TaxID=281687 RepID=A0A8R1ESB0_CAEJA
MSPSSFRAPVEKQSYTETASSSLELELEQKIDKSVSVAKSIQNLSRLLTVECQEAHPCTETKTWLFE